MLQILCKWQKERPTWSYIFKSSKLVASETGSYSVLLASGASKKYINFGLKWLWDCQAAPITARAARNFSGAWSLVQRLRQSCWIGEFFLLVKMRRKSFVINRTSPTSLVFKTRHGVYLCQFHWLTLLTDCLWFSHKLLLYNLWYHMTL